MGLTGIVLTPGSFNLTSHSCGHGLPLGTIILQSSFLILPLSPVQRQSSSSFLMKPHSAVFSTRHDISQVLDKSSPLPWLSCEVSQGFSRRNMGTITAWLRTSAPVQWLMDRTRDLLPPLETLLVLLVPKSHLERVYTGVRQAHRKKYQENYLGIESKRRKMRWQKWVI